MKKIKFGRNLLLAILISFILFGIVEAIDLKSINAEMYNCTAVPLAFTCAGAGVILWFWSFWDFYDNYSKFKKPTLVFILLLTFNWLAAIAYYFTVIYKREKAKA